MARDDDPESRIRELERTLSEQAKASELTASGPSWPAARPTQRRSARPILLSAIAVGAVAAPVAAAVIFFAGDFPAGGPSVSGTPSAGHDAPSAGHESGVSVPAAPRALTDSESSQSVVVNGTTVLAGPGLIELPGQSGGPDGPIQIAGVGGSRTVACNDRPVSVSGVSNTVVLTGHCASVNVSGIDNTITVDSAAQIVTSGMRNRVTYHSGTPDIPDPGESNIVERG